MNTCIKSSTNIYIYTLKNITFKARIHIYNTSTHILYLKTLYKDSSHLTRENILMAIGKAVKLVRRLFRYDSKKMKKPS